MVSSDELDQQVASSEREGERCVTKLTAGINVYPIKEHQLTDPAKLVLISASLACVDTCTCYIELDFSD